MKQNSHKSNFDCLVRSRLLADDFAQPDDCFYKNRAIQQIETAVQSIRNSSSSHDFFTSITEANAFIKSAYHFEFINLSEKLGWEKVVQSAVREQTFEA